MAKQPKTKRTEVKDLSIGAKELTQAQAEQVKGGVAGRVRGGGLGLPGSNPCPTCKSDPCKCTFPTPPIPSA